MDLMPKRKALGGGTRVVGAEMVVSVAGIGLIERVLILMNLTRALVTMQWMSIIILSIPTNTEINTVPVAVSGGTVGGNDGISVWS